MAKYLSRNLSNVEFFDLQENPLPMCDGDKCYDLPEVKEFREKIKNAKGIVMAIQSTITTLVPGLRTL